MTIGYNKNMKRKYLILIPIVILLVISIIYLPNTLKIKQLIWSFLGLILCLVISRLKFKRILKYSLIYYILGVCSLAIVLILNKFTNGSRGWIDIGFFSFQPSEFMKVALILFGIKYYKKINIFLFVASFLLPMVLIFLEPDTGAVIIEGIILLYFILTKFNLKKKKIFLGICFSLLIFLFTFICFKHDLLIKIIGPNIFYRLDRLTNFINDNSIQTTNALISIAVGSTLYFPEMFNDFFIAYVLSKNIYMIIPLVLASIVLFIVLKKKNTSISQVVFYSFLFQCYWNIAMNLKLVPVIGIPYLFFSYGGSHTISSFILIGLILSMDNNKDKVLE